MFSRAPIQFLIICIDVSIQLSIYHWSSVWSFSSLWSIISNAKVQFSKPARQQESPSSTPVMEEAESPRLPPLFFRQYKRECHQQLSNYHCRHHHLLPLSVIRFEDSHQRTGLSREASARARGGRGADVGMPVMGGDEGRHARTLAFLGGRDQVREVAEACALLEGGAGRCGSERGAARGNYGAARGRGWPAGEVATGLCSAPAGPASSAPTSPASSSHGADSWPAAGGHGLAVNGRRACRPSSGAGHARISSV